MKYTIIVTVYNKEKYLEKCLESVCNQTYKDYSIIIVNDGSTDGSEEIIKKYKKNYNIQYYSKKNTGIADTRNYAIRKVKTEYFLFIDADDYISLELLENIDKYNNYDLLSFNAINLNENMEFIKEMKKTAFQGRGEDFFIALEKEKCYYTVPWGYVYNTNYFRRHNFLYPKGKILEDYYLTPLIIIESDRVISIEYSGYFYITNSDSIINNKNNIQEVEETYFYYFDKLNEYIEQAKYSEKIKKTYKSFLANTLIWYGSTIDGEEQKQYVKKVVQRKVSMNSKLKEILFKANLFYKIRKILKKIGYYNKKIIL